ncbi:MULTISPECIES: Asr1405/Asl0597 family protein [unclassified Anabaena]|uniref:Asr1405/Asl0597 family protein n=1 Tax=unclassified Anabaena TaxID=2619674 RepID=UPI00082D126E|nr:MULTISPECIES: Asr1405/Asl0597 family protein [unclassified Anabaena]
MKSFSSEAKQKYLVEVNWIDRWQVYQRLQELEIPCSCQTNQPLSVEINTPTAATQLWSVIREFTASRQEKISTLKSSWRIPYRHSDRG